MKLVAPRHGEPAFHVERGQHLVGEHAIVNVRRIGRDCAEHQIAGSFTLKVPTPERRRQVIGEILRVAGERVPA